MKVLEVTEYSTHSLSIECDGVWVDIDYPFYAKRFEHYTDAYNYFIDLLRDERKTAYESQD